MTRLDQTKKPYYIALASGQIMKTATDSPWDFKIEADDDEITKLREYFDQNYSTEWQSFIRAHVPYVQYHYDRENDAYDETLVQIYKMIYELGDEEAKQHIRSIGVVPNLQ
ncbi:hydrolase [Bacillus sp. DNRA2]|uniref:hydrolase n=1 Tax=Bacillus sp. DNRA2 TaxID=2723053 RepID=UPI00145EE41D|nr:hydrolase [Bacillus sp. DNRA2]NMD72136.1 hydrolase [Bacillus sp. DNRA2]